MDTLQYASLASLALIVLASLVLYHQHRVVRKAAGRQAGEDLEF